MLFKASEFSTRDAMHSMTNEEVMQYKKEVLEYGKAKVHELLNSDMDTYQALSEAKQIIGLVLIELETVNAVRLLAK